MLNDIKWDVFTKEERANIESLVSAGRFDAVTRCIAMDTAEKEYWIGRILDQARPVAEPIDSKVRAEMLAAQAGGETIDTPEKEKEWQDKLAAEKEEQAAKKKAKKEKK